MIVIKPLIGLFLLLSPHARGPAALPRDAGADETCFVQQTNATRASKGLSVLPVSGSLASEARTHSQAMASSNSLYHSTADQYPGNWIGLGENVGVGPTCNDVQQAFLASPHHYENIVDPKWTSIGIGVVPSSDGNGLWVTVAFEQFQATPAPPAPAPAPAPAPTPAPAPKPAPTTPAPPRTTAPTPARTVVPAPPRTVAPTPTPSHTALPSPSPSPTPVALPSPSPTPVALPSPSPTSATPTSSVTPSTPGAVPATNVPQVLASAKASRGFIGLGVAMVLCLAVGAVWGFRDRKRR
jgi:hypothetical protein